MRYRLNIGIMLLALVVAGGLLYGFYPRAVPVDLVAVASGPFTVAIEEEGKTRVMDRFEISAPMTGYALRIDRHAGDTVTEGEVLAVIEPARADALDPRARTLAEAQVKAAEAKVAAAWDQARAASAEAELAQQVLTRSEALGASRHISAQALDQARSAAARTRAAQQAADHSVTVARFELEIARATLAKTAQLQAGGAAETIEVRAPVAAHILKILHESEGTVQAGQPLLEIGNPELLEAEIEVLSTQAVQISPGSKVLFDRWGGATTLQGVVRTIEPAGFTKISALGVEEQRVRVIADFVSPREEWQRLGDGYRIEARFVIWEGTDVLHIPAGALFRYNGGWAVFVAEEGYARLRPVTIGRRAGLIVQISSGLMAGEMVINHPSDRILDGTRIKSRYNYGGH